VIGAAIALWPVLRELGARGGSLEFLGLKAQINALERRTEEDLALRVDQLRADLEDLRAHLPSERGLESATTGEDEQGQEILFEAVTEYRAHRDKASGWRGRVAVDRALASTSRRPSVKVLRQALDAQPRNPELAMAAAVLLGIRERGEDDLEAANLLARLARSPLERVRFRAARSIERLSQRSDTSAAARKILTNAAQNAMARESAEVVLRAFQDAARSLK
jgi:hypothetical protein